MQGGKLVSMRICCSSANGAGVQWSKRQGRRSRAEQGGVVGGAVSPITDTAFTNSYPTRFTVFSFHAGAVRIDCSCNKAGGLRPAGSHRLQPVGFGLQKSATAPVPYSRSAVHCRNISAGLISDGDRFVEMWLDESGER